MRLEWLKVLPPLRSGRWRLARDRGHGEVALGIGVALGARVGAVVVDQEASAAKVLLHAPDRALQHLADLAGLQVAERLPGELGALLGVGAIENDQVQARLAFESLPMASIETWRSPVLLVHGDDDRNVPFSETVDVAVALRKQGVELEELVYPDDVHDFLVQSHWVEVFEKAAEFFERRMPRPRP